MKTYYKTIRKLERQKMTAQTVCINSQSADPNETKDNNIKHENIKLSFKGYNI